MSHRFIPGLPFWLFLRARCLYGFSYHPDRALFSTPTALSPGLSQRGAGKAITNVGWQEVTAIPPPILATGKGWLLELWRGRCASWSAALHDAHPQTARQRHLPLKKDPK